MINAPKAKEPDLIQDILIPSETLADFVWFGEDLK